MVALKSWAPDLPPFGHDNLVTAKNVVPGPLGYTPAPSLVAATAALPAAWKGGGSFIGVGGTSVMLAGAAGGLYKLTASAATNKHSGTYTARWYFAQFGDLVVCVNGQAPVKYTIATDTGAALGGSPPTSTMVAIVRDFVFLAGNSSAVSTVYWSAINNAEGWTAGTDQSDDQVLPDGGEITGLAGGEFGLVFQADAINRFDYQGLPFIFTRSKVSDNVGAICHGSIARSGNMVFFKHRTGFYKYEDGALEPIGAQKVDTTFAQMYSVADIKNNLSAAIDPYRKLVIWAMPDRLWLYNWELKAWSYIEIAGLSGITVGRTASATLEGLDATYPDVDAMTISLDDPQFQGGEPFLMAAYSDFKLYSFGGPNLAALMRMAIQEPFNGRETIVRGARIDGDITAGASLRLDCSARLADSQTTFEASTVRANGDTPIRARGRYIQPELAFNASAAWNYVQGFDVYGVAGGRQ
ncbi:MAG TPA: hypothetical protein VLA99_05940 [Nitrospiraceae bacterium]|nr:hypothetical protein [Nitrospiraceae bacterium]